jgi:hypothetical protein
MFGVDRSLLHKQYAVEYLPVSNQFNPLIACWQTSLQVGEVAHLARGVKIALDYLNHARNETQLDGIKRRARFWVEQYFNCHFRQTVTYLRQASVFKMHHRHVFDYFAPPAARFWRDYVQPDLMVDVPISASTSEASNKVIDKPAADEPAPEDTTLELEKFPAYSEPTLANDFQLQFILNWSKRNGRWKRSRPAYTGVTPADLAASSIGHHLPVFLVCLALNDVPAYIREGRRKADRKAS